MAKQTGPEGGQTTGRNFAYIAWDDGVPQIIVKWGALGMGVFGGIALALFEGLISLPLGLARAATFYFDTVANRIAMLIRAVFGADGAFRVAWLEANAQVVSSGILAFALGVAVVGSVTAVYSWGVTRLG